MIRLDTTTRKLQIILGGAVTTNQLPVTVCFSDKTLTTYVGGAQVALTNGGTAVDICAAPAASTVRDIDSIDIQNADTVAAVVTVRYNDNATLYTLFKATLSTGDQLTYTHGQGWRVLNPFGSIKQVPGPVPSSAVTGTITNDSAAAGILGEYFSSEVPFASAMALSNGVAANVTSISLTPGDWDVSASVYFTPPTTVTFSAAHGSFSTVSATINNNPGQFYFFAIGSFVITTNQVVSTVVPADRISLAVTTTVYLVAYLAFSAGGAGAYGKIHARRVR